MPTVLSLALSLLGMIVMFSACASAPQELDHGVHVVHAMTSEKYLVKSAFYAAYPDGKPSDYVRYFFSDIGVSEWPPRDGGFGYDEMEVKQFRTTGLPIMPNEILYKANTPNLDSNQMQVVLKGDDAKGVLIIEGYVNPTGKPVIVKEKKIPKVQPEEMAVMTYQSAIQMGASDGSQ